MMTYLLIGSAVLVLLMLYVIYSAKSKPTDHTSKENPEHKNPQEPCILCGSLLAKGERMKSREYKGENDSIVRIMGCPHCFGPGGTKERICPVCKRKMPPDSYLQGRMWLKKSGKKHLHISGCTQCIGKRI